MGEPVADQRQGQFRVGIVDTGHRTQIEGLPESAASINMASERIPRHMEYIRNLVEAMLDILEIILNLPAARNHDLVAAAHHRLPCGAVASERTEHENHGARNGQDEHKQPQGHAMQVPDGLPGLFEA